MSTNICEFCEKCFKDSYSLKRHLNTAKKCKKNREENTFDYVCEYCTNNFSNEYNLSRHFKICKKYIMLQDKQKEDEYKNKIKELENKNYLLEEKYNLSFASIKTLEEKYNSVLSKLDIYKDNELEYKEKINKLETTIETLAAKAIENSGNKTTINNRNQIYNALQPLTEEHMREQTKYLTYKDVKNGIEGMAHFASKHTFKDRVACSDKTRLNFVFKNEHDNIIKDPEGIEITKRFIEINKDELLRFLEEYYNFIIGELDKDLDIIEYRHWAKRREEIITIRSAVKRGNIPENKDSYDEFKKSFLSVLSELVPR